MGEGPKKMTDARQGSSSFDCIMRERERLRAVVDTQQAQHLADQQRIAELETKVRDLTTQRDAARANHAEERERLAALWNAFKNADALDAAAAWNEIDRALGER